MPVPQITITPAGFAAIVNAENTGTAPVKLTHVGLTAQHFDVLTVGATVPGEAKRLTTFGGKAVADDTLHLNVRDDSADTYTLRGFGLYLQDGTLFAVYSQATPIMEKAAAATLLLATDIRFAKITATSIEVGDIDFINPPASTTQMGVVRLATEQEADTGSDQTTAITPRGLAGYINRRFGDGAPSTFVKRLLSVATAAIFRAELGLKSAAVRDEGPGNGLDADKLDGAHGDYYLDWRNFVGLPSSFPPAQHGHPISEVVGLADELARKTNRTGDTFTGTLAVNGAALRSYGWNGVASNGVLMLGDTGSFIQKAGAYFDFTNSAGGYTATLAAGGTIWTSGNFDPAAKVSRNGDTMTGKLVFHGSGNAIRRFEVFHNADSANDYGGKIALSYSASTTALAEIALVPTGPSGFRTQINFNLKSGDFYNSALLNYMQLTTTGLNVIGAISPSGGFDFGSSRKLKTIDGDMPYGLEEVRRITTLIGRYKPDYQNDGRTRLFFDAEQLAEVMPEAVDLEGVLFRGEYVPSIKLDQVLPPAYRAIAQLADLVDQLRADVASLKRSQ